MLFFLCLVHILFTAISAAPSSTYPTCVSGLKSATRARPPRRRPNAFINLSDVFATTITNISSGIAIQPMIQSFRPPNWEWPSIATIETERLSGANQRATAVRLDCFLPSLIAIDASSAGTAFSVRWSRTFNLFLTSSMSTQISSRASGLVLRDRSDSIDVSWPRYEVILLDNLWVLCRIVTGFCGLSQKSCSSWSSSAETWRSIWNATVFQSTRILDKGVWKWFISDESNSCPLGKALIAVMLSLWSVSLE